MEQFIAEELVDRDVELYCVGTGKFNGKIRSVKMGVVILEWEEKQTYIACDKIVAIWPKDQGEGLSPSIGFLHQ